MNVHYISDKLIFLPVILFLAAQCALAMDSRIAQPVPVLTPEQVAQLMPELKTALHAAETDSVHVQALANFKHYELCDVAQNPMQDLNASPTVAKLKKLFMQWDENVDPKANPQAYGLALRKYLGQLKHLSSALLTQHEYMNTHFGVITLLALEDLRNKLCEAVIEANTHDTLCETFEDFADFYDVMQKTSENTITCAAVVPRSCAAKMICGNRCELNEFEQEAPTAKAGNVLRTSAKHMEALYNMLDNPHRNNGTQEDAHRICMSYITCFPSYHLLYKAARAATTQAIRDGVTIESNKTAFFLNYLKQDKHTPFPPALSPMITMPTRSILYNYQVFYKAHASDLEKLSTTCAQTQQEDDVLAAILAKPSAHSPAQRKKKKKKSRKKQNLRIVHDAQDTAEEVEEITTAARALHIENKVLALDGSYFMRNTQEKDTVTIHDPKNNITITLLGRVHKNNKPSITKCKYIGTIKKWFDNPQLALDEAQENCQPYATDEEHKRAIIIHNFAKTVDTFIETHAHEYITRTRPHEQKSERALIMPAKITYKNSGKEEIGYFAYLIRPDGTCFHRMFDVRKAHTPLTAELNQQGFFTHYPLLDK